MAHLDLPQAQLWYEQTGAGTDIVWLAAGDMPGESWRAYQVPAFQDFRNTTWDARGAGRTTSDASSPWPIETHAADCVQLIEKSLAIADRVYALARGTVILEAPAGQPGLPQQLERVYFGEEGLHGAAAIERTPPAAASTRPQE